MKLLFASPSPDDLIRLLRAWRFWLVGGLAGALLGSAVYLIAPPPFRAQATVNVDFHLEQAWPENSDREQFYYLERETRKLEEIAMSDAVLNAVVSQVGGVSLRQLRGGKLHLSQPGNGGWHFYADDRSSARAGQLASGWARAFAQAVQAQVAQPSSALEKFITAEPAQVEELPVRRSVGMSVYLLAGAFVVLALTSFGVLFLGTRV